MANQPNQPIRNFTVFRKAKQVELIGELSTVEALGADVQQGISVEGDTGVVEFQLAKVIRDEHENELIGYELKPTPESVCRVPAAANVIMVLFND